MVIDELRQTYPLTKLLAYLDVARATFYYHLKQSKQMDKHQDLKNDIAKVYHTHKGRYGYRRITFALKRLGYRINHKKVQRLMKQMGLQAVIRRKRGLSTYKGMVGTIANNVLNRNFKADKPNQKWATDVTEFKIYNHASENDGNSKQQKLYLSPMIDLFNGEIISYCIKDRPTYNLVQEMLEDALMKLEQDNVLNRAKGKPNDKPIVHSDQGWQYQMTHFGQTLKGNQLTQSMSRKGNCIDNAVIESFFGTLKQEIFYEQTKFTSLDELKKTIDEYIHYYNHDRIKTKLKGLSPVAYRNLVLGQASEFYQPNL